MTTVEHGFKLDAIRASIDREEWEDDPENPGQKMRRIFLGSFQAITPSGKFYTPFACSNVEPCSACGGSGSLNVHRKRRIDKKRRSRHAHTIAMIVRMTRNLPAKPWDSDDPRYREVLAFVGRQPKCYRMLGFSGPTCTHCGGIGSREAYLDELWHEATEKALESIGLCLDGDCGDYFAVECRDGTYARGREA